MIDTKLVEHLLERGRSVSPLAALRAASFDPGQSSSVPHAVRAQVAARLPDGTFRVVIDGRALKLALPPEIKPGDTVELRIVSRTVETSVDRGAVIDGGETLSSAGQVLARVLAQPRGDPPRQSVPVVPVPPSKPEELPEPLARAVERSGVFYESHQARWIEGEYPLQRLLQEPQASLRRQASQPLDTTVASSARPATAAERTSEKPVLALPAPAPALQAAAEAMPEPASAPSTPAGAGACEPAEQPPQNVPKEALPLVRQQIDTLETRQLTWLGEIWPGQTMRWQIGEESAREPDFDEPSAWHSRFELCLPLLGDVGADIQLDGSRLRIRLTAQDPATASEMRSAAAELVQALQTSGLQVAACTVTCHECTP